MGAEYARNPIYCCIYLFAFLALPDLELYVQTTLALKAASQALVLKAYFTQWNTY